MTGVKRKRIRDTLNSPVKILDALKEFKCQINFFGNEQQGPRFTAYCMDGEVKTNGVQCSDMRHEAAKIGPCSCCDYMQIRGNVIALIEVSDIARKVRDIREGCGDMPESLINKHVEEMMRIEFVQKVYGGLLVLCRMGVYKKLLSELGCREYVVIFVHNGGDDLLGADSFLTNIFGKIEGGVEGLAYKKYGTKIRACFVSPNIAKTILCA